jgi:hypothetical protein
MEACAGPGAVALPSRGLRRVPHRRACATMLSARCIISLRRSLLGHAIGTGTAETCHVYDRW